MGQSLIQRAFAGGELAPALYARADQAKYQTGLRRCHNFVVQRHGGVANRAGFRFIDAVKEDGPTCQLLRYVSEVPGESLLIEMGTDYLRFFQNGAAVEVVLADVDAWDVATDYVIGDLVQHGGIIYYAKQNHVSVEPPDGPWWYGFTAGTVLELPSPFGTDLPNWYQSGRVITLTHKNKPPYELEQVSLTRWVLRPIVTTATIPQVTGVTLTPGGAAGARTFAYVVTAALAGSYEEGPVSAQIVAAGIEAPTPDAPHVLTWDAVADAVEYYVYSDPYANGTYGFLGTATGTATFNDVGATPDFALTPAVARDLFSTVKNYPHVATDYQQRRWFAHTITEPDGIWGSRTGFRANFSISSPLQDDDSLSFRIAGNNHNPVQHLFGLKSLIVLTGAGEWTVGEPKQPLTPTALTADQETYVGAADIRPVIVGNSVIYLQARGSIIHDLQFDQQVEGLGGKDLTIFAAHLFDGYQVVALDYAQVPHSIVWAVRSDGRLLGLTYVREQDVWGWHWHDTGAHGRFEEVCVVPELTGDAVYVIVRRTIGGSFVRYIERLEPRTILAFKTDAFFVDSGLTYTGPPVLTVGGLDHLEGESVVALADGIVRGPFVVTGGAVTLPVGASVVHAGLPITADIETLDPDVAGSSLRDKKKRVGSLSLLLETSARVFTAGPDAAHLTPYVRPPHEPAADLFTGSVELTLFARFGSDAGRVFVQQTAPLPLTILGVIPNLEAGG
jgi:hypothetical protein